MEKSPPGLAVPTSIRDRRDALGWSQDELAARAGVSTVTIHNLEAEKNGFTDKSLAKISAALGCSPAELLTPMAGERPAKIHGEAQILAMLARIDGLSDTDITLAFGVISNSLKATRAGSEPSGSRDQPQPASRPHAKAPLR